MTEQEWLTSDDPAAMLVCVRGKASDRKLRLFACACARQVWHMLIDPRSRAAVEVAERFADGLATEWELGTAGEAAYGAMSRGPLDAYGMRAAAAEASALCRPNVLDGIRTGLLTEPCGDQAAQADLLREVFGDPFRPLPFWRNQGEPGLGPIGDYATNRVTPTVLALARTAYADRLTEACGACGGVGYTWIRLAGDEPKKDCPNCRGTGRVETGHLDPGTLAVLSDALEEAGVPTQAECRLCKGMGAVERLDSGYMRRFGLREWNGCKGCGGDGNEKRGTGRVPNLLLAHLRSPGPHWRGCWAVDCVTGRK